MFYKFDVVLIRLAYIKLGSIWPFRPLSFAVSAIERFWIGMMKYMSMFSNFDRITTDDIIVISELLGRKKLITISLKNYRLKYWLKFGKSFVNLLKLYFNRYKIHSFVAFEIKKMNVFNIKYAIISIQTNNT